MNKMNYPEITELVRVLVEINKYRENVPELFRATLKEYERPLFDAVTRDVKANIKSKEPEKKKLKTEVITRSESDVLQNAINRYLSKMPEKEIVDIKFSISCAYDSNDESFVEEYAAMIIYKE